MVGIECTPHGRVCTVSAHEQRTAHCRAIDKMRRHASIILLKARKAAARLQTAALCAKTCHERLLQLSTVHVELHAAKAPREACVSAQGDVKEHSPSVIAQRHVVLIGDATMDERKQEQNISTTRHVSEAMPGVGALDEQARGLRQRS